MWEVATRYWTIWVRASRTSSALSIPKSIIRWVTPALACFWRQNTHTCRWRTLWSRNFPEAMIIFRAFLLLEKIVQAHLQLSLDLLER